MSKLFVKSLFVALVLPIAMFGLLSQPTKLGSAIMCVRLKSGKVQCFTLPNTKIMRFN